MQFDLTPQEELEKERAAFDKERFTRMQAKHNECLAKVATIKVQQRSNHTRYANSSRMICFTHLGPQKMLDFNRHGPSRVPI
jgi:hypothetical protein